MDYIVSDLAICQSQSADGYLSGIPDGKRIFAKIAATGVVDGWVPWYTQHKVMAGLRDSYRYAGNTEAKPIFLKMCDWADNITKGLTSDQVAVMLDTEHGGMAEVAGDAYAMTADPRYLVLARRFTHHELLDPIAAGHDILTGYHSNTQIPKFIGYGRLYELTGEQQYRDGSQNFYDDVVNRRSFNIGGNGDGEHFFDPAHFEQHLISDATSESCSTYNMLKLTRLLFQRSPTVDQAEYYERALYNNILASQEHTSGLMSYFSPTRPGHYKVYGTPEDSFWCCTGTGMENHSKYGDSIYFHDNDTLYVNLFIPSSVRWADKGLSVNQETRFPEENVSRFTLTTKHPVSATIKLRHPKWAKSFTVLVNGKSIKTNSAPGSYAAVTRDWRSGDKIVVKMPMELSLEPLPNSTQYQVIKYGPLILVAALGVDAGDSIEDISTSQVGHSKGDMPEREVPKFKVSAVELLSKIKPASGLPLAWQTHDVGQPNDVTLVPYYALHHQRYNMYWRIMSADEWKKDDARIAAEEKARAEMDARSLDSFNPGEQQSEVDHNLQTLDSNSGPYNDMHWRDARGWFSYDMKVSPTEPVDLLCTYWGSDANGRIFDILVDNTVIATQSLDATKPGKFFDVVYTIPAALTKGKQKVTVMLRAKPGMLAGGLFGSRTMMHTMAATIPTAV